jgi:hypothetical protein
LVVAKRLSVALISFREYDYDVLMISAEFDDFDAFATTVGEVDGVMLLQNPTRRSWSLSAADLIWLEAGFRVVSAS